MSNSWLAFWKGENAFDNSMDINYTYFLKKVERYATPTKNSLVLDVGSGPGNLEDAWHDMAREIHGVDISERYNKIAREKHAAHSNVFFHDLPPDDYLNFSVLGNKRFDIIIVMSVVQYYKNKQEVIRLVQNLSGYASPGAVLLLCDLIVKNSFVKEIIDVLSNAFRERKLSSMLTLLFKLRFSAYYKVKKKAGLLVMSQQEWKEIIHELNLNAKFTDEPITLQKTRKSLVVYF